jgi:hypothetical protein
MVGRYQKLTELPLRPGPRLQRMIYPESNAYRSETGGVMSALRDLTVEQSASAGPRPSSHPHS